MPYRYVPMIRSKAGEAVALDHLLPAAKQRMLPVIHLTTEVPATFLPRFITAWAGLPVAVDSTWNFGQTGTTTAFAATINGLRAAGLPAFPCVEVDAAAGYLATVRQTVAAAPALGVAVKARLNQVANVQAWLAPIGWIPQSTDLIIEAGYLPAVGRGVLDPLVVQHINSLGQVPWRSVTLSASAAPRDFGALVLGPNLIPRLDWQLWQSVSPQVNRALDYGDFGTSHPDMTDPPGFAMANATVSVKYALDSDWLMIKGRPGRGRTGIPMAQQYLAHAVALRAHPTFGGVPGCWADTRIAQIAGRLPGPGGRPATSGSRTSWVEIGMNRHLSLIATRLP